MKKVLKVLSTITLVLWSIALTLALSFGVGTARKMVKIISNFYNTYFNNFEIESVEIVNLEEKYLTNKTFYLEYEVTASKTKDYELIFKSLDPDVFTVTSIGAIKGKVFSEEERVGRLQITSRIDKNYKLEVPITFYNTFPEEFSPYAFNSNKATVKEVYVNVPFYIYPNIKNSSKYTNNTFTIEFDEEIFEKVGTNKYMPLKAADSTIVKIKVGDQVKELDLKVVEKEIEIPDSFKVCTSNNVPHQVGNTSYIKLYKDDKLVTCNFRINADNEQKISVGSYDNISFSSNGEKTINVDILDNNGEVIKTLTETITVFTKKETIDLSLIPDEITIYQYERAKIKLNLPYKTEVIKNGESLSASYNYNEKVLNLYDPNPSEKKVKLEMTLFDGEKEYNEVREIKIIILKDTTAKAYVSSQTSTFVAKIMGHMGLFLLEGILAIWFIIFHHHKKHKIYDVLVYISIGLSVGMLTEFIQIFLEGRHPALKDVGIDFTGYLIGGTLAFVIYLFTSLMKKIVHKKHESK